MLDLKMNEYPEELLIPPRPMVAVLADATFKFADPLVASLSHCGISSPTAGPAVRLRYESFPLNHRFPKRERAHGQDYDSYTPQGILRSNWMHKHANLPALMLLAWTFDLRVTSAEWATREGALVSAILALRDYARGRGQDVHLLLVHENRIPVGRTMGGEDFYDLLSERITAVRRKSGLDGNAVTVSTTDDIADGERANLVLLQGLDASLRDRVLSYYQRITRRIKSILPRLRLPIQAALRARLLFKTAHFQEFRGRHPKAIKYYAQCSAALQAMAVSPAFLSLVSEVKRVADLVNFKLMIGYLQSGFGMIMTPAGMQVQGAHAAVMQFNQHMRAVEGALSSDDRARPWTHWASLSRQYVVAAELLQLNLPRPRADTKPSYLPSHYYHTAALYASKRRKAVESAGVIPSPRVAISTIEDGDTQVVGGPLLAVVNGVQEALGHTAGGTGFRTQQVVVAEAEIAKWAVAEPWYVGANPQVAQMVDGKPVSVAAALASGVLTAASIVAESRVKHSTLVMQLLEKAQAMAPVDGGTGSAVRTHGAGLPPSDQEALFYSKGSNFTYEVGHDASRGRLWRQSLLAEEAWSMGKVDSALRLLLPVAERFRCEKAWVGLSSTLLRIRECACVTQDVPLYIASSIELLNVAQQSSIGLKADALARHLAAVLRAHAKQSPASGTLPPVPPVLTFPLAVASPLPVDVDDARSRFGRAPLPDRCNAALRKPDAPLLSAIVAFSSRCAQRGLVVRMRLILTSGMPRPMLCDTVHVTCAHAEGDFTLRVEGQGADSARPLVSGMRQLAGASPFDVKLVHGPAPAGASLDAEVLQLMSTPVARDGAGTRLLTLPLLLPSRGSLAVEWEVELPGLESESTEGKGINSAVLAPLPPDAAVGLAREAALADQSDASVPGLDAAHAGRWDGCCTDPAEMSLALAVPSARTGIALPSSDVRAESGHVSSAWDPRSETILPQRVVLAWSGREKEEDVGGVTMHLDVLPRAFGTGCAQRLASPLEKLPVTPGLGLSPLDSLLACLTQHRIPTHLALADSLTPAVAHMVRTGVGLGSARGAVGAFLPGGAGLGYAWGELPSVSTCDAVVVADEEAVARVRTGSAPFLQAAGTSVQAAAAAPDTTDTSTRGVSAPAPLPVRPGVLSHEYDGACVARQLPYHPMLLVLAPDAHVSVTLSAALPTPVYACAGPAAVVGVPSPMRLSVTSGRRGMTGGLLKLAAAGVVRGNEAEEGGLVGVAGMADVALEGAVIALPDGPGLEVEPTPGRDMRGSEGDRSPSLLSVQLLVHSDTLVVRTNGSVVPASVARDRGNDVNGTMHGQEGGLVPLGRDIAGIALPSLAAGISYSFHVYVTVCPTPQLLLAGPDTPSASILLRTEAHVCEEGGSIEPVQVAGQGQAWLAALQAQPTLHRSLVTDLSLPAYNAFAVRAVALGDPSSPLLDLGPLLLSVHGAQQPLSGTPQAWDKGGPPPVPAHLATLLTAARQGPVYSLLGLGPPTGAHSLAGHVRVGSSLTCALDLQCCPVAPCTLTGVELEESKGSGVRLLTTCEALSAQVGLHRLGTGAGQSDPPSLADSVASALASCTPGLSVETGRCAALTLRYSAIRPGVHSLGVVKLSWHVTDGIGGVHTLALPLPSVAVHDPTVRASLTYPVKATVGEKCQLALQLTNGSAHFHAVEVTATPPPALGHTGESGGRAGPAPIPPILPVPSMELTGYARFIVELLPGASKAVTFSLLPHASGPVALPLIGLRASTGSKAGGQGLEGVVRALSPAADTLYTLCSTSTGAGRPLPRTVFVAPALVEA